MLRVETLAGSASLLRHPWTRQVLAGLTLLVVAGLSNAAEKPRDGLIVQIPTTLTTESTGRLRSLLHGPIHRFKQNAAPQGGQFVLLCEFNPEGRTAASEDFGASYDLAKYLRSLDGIRTVAYIRGEVRRHSVLPALACKELVFSEEGRLGQVAAAGTRLPRAEQTAYEEITNGRYPDVLIRKMFDPSIEVVRLGDQLLDGAKPRAGAQPIPGLLAGEVALYTFAQARQLGLCDPLPRASLDEVRLAYDVPRSSSLRTLDRVVCWRIVLDGPVDGALVEQTKRRIERALRARVNVLILELNCSGGSSDKAHELGLYLASLNDTRKDNPIETIAYVTGKARNLATFIAFGCNKIILQRGEEQAGRAANGEDEDDVLPNEGRLGGFSLFVSRHPATEELRKQLQEQEKAGGRRPDTEQKLQEAITNLEATLSAQLREIISKQLYPPVLADGMFDRALKIHLVERAVGATGGRLLLSDTEFQADQRGPKQWRSVMLVKPWEGQPRFEGRYLTLSARQAKELEVADEVVKDLPELYQVVGIKQEEVKTVEADWLDGLADFLRHPWTSVVLVMLGITCLILEMKMPGVGLPGVISAICFVLFFWAHSQLHGQITWLWILLFVLGLLLIALEIFVLPGFGVCGVSGVLLLLASLGLIAYGHWPRSSEEWLDLGNKIAPFGISLLGSLVLVALVLRYLPHIPVLNRLMYRPSEETEDAEQELDHPMHAELQSLLGAIGVAATPLRPAGKTQFGDAYVDVVAEGAFIMPGTRVQVIEVEGNRVVVKEV